MSEFVFFSSSFLFILALGAFAEALFASASNHRRKSK